MKAHTERVRREGRVFFPQRRKGAKKKAAKNAEPFASFFAPLRLCGKNYAGVSCGRTFPLEL